MGKVSRASRLKYTPSGEAVCEFVIAAPQEYFGSKETGYFEVMVTGALAEDTGPKLKVGSRIRLSGRLWARTFRNRQGLKVTETKILALEIEGDTNERKN